MNWLAAAPLALLAAAASAADWSPEKALEVKRVQSVQVSPDGIRVAYVVGSAVTEGEKSEWLSHVHVGARRRIERVRADVGRQVVDRSRLVAGREVDRVPLRPRARRTRTARTRRRTSGASASTAARRRR